MLGRYVPTSGCNNYFTDLIFNLQIPLACPICRPNSWGKEYNDMERGRDGDAFHFSDFF